MIVIDTYTNKKAEGKFTKEVIEKLKKMGLWGVRYVEKAEFKELKKEEAKELDKEK